MCTHRNADDHDLKEPFLSFFFFLSSCGIKLPGIYGGQAAFVNIKEDAVIYVFSCTCLPKFHVNALKKIDAVSLLVCVCVCVCVWTPAVRHSGPIQRPAPHKASVFHVHCRPHAIVTYRPRERANVRNELVAACRLRLKRQSAAHR